MSKQFKPSKIAMILTLFGVLILLKLGFWQLHRAHEKLLIEEALAKRPTLAVVTEQEFAKLTPEELAFRRVKITGFFDSNHQFLLDNQHAEHRIGFRVLTPFFIAKSGHRLLVDRGFIPKSTNINELPILKPIVGVQTIEGIVEPEIKKNFVLGTIQQTKNWPMIIEAIDFPFIEQQLEQTFMPVMLQLDASNKSSFLQSWKAVQVSHQRHIAYAVQWFLLAAALVIVFIVASFKKVSKV